MLVLNGHWMRIKSILDVIWILLTRANSNKLSV